MNSVITRTISKNAIKSTHIATRLNSSSSSSSSCFASSSKLQLRSIHNSQPLDPNESNADSISQLNNYIKTEQPELDSVTGLGERVGELGLSVGEYQS